MWNVWGRKKKFVHGFREGTLREVEWQVVDSNDLAQDKDK
jgi:hypothetical protein